MVDVAVGCNSTPAPDPAHLVLVLSTHNLQQTASEDTAQIGHMGNGRRNEYTEMR